VRQPRSFVGCRICGKPISKNRVASCSEECAQQMIRDRHLRDRRREAHTHNLFQILAISSTITKTQIQNEC
jgi:predicted nucleic acid-binding Zn ribbon protein